MGLRVSNHTSHNCQIVQTNSSFHNYSSQVWLECQAKFTIVTSLHMMGLC